MDLVKCNSRVTSVLCSGFCITARPFRSRTSMQLQYRATVQSGNSTRRTAFQLPWHMHAPQFQQQPTPQRPSKLAYPLLRQRLLPVKPAFHLGHGFRRSTRLVLPT
jgi:hypothetical protein